jgi:nicotinate-nucleotide adenylyltransferase
MAEPCRRLAIMGGTFDPIHYGHLLLAEEARERFHLDRVVFVPNGRPHKKHYRVTDPEERYAMCVIAIASNPYLSCSRVEIERPGPSYAIDTIQWFRENNPDLEALYFITGADAVMEILSWHRYPELSQACEFIAATRPGSDLELLCEVIDPGFLERIHFLQIPGLDISSSNLRRRVREKRTIKYQTPEGVEAYIRHGGLYRIEDDNADAPAIPMPPAAPARGAPG